MKNIVCTQNKKSTKKQVDNKFKGENLLISKLTEAGKNRKLGEIN